MWSANRSNYIFWALMIWNCSWKDLVGGDLVTILGNICVIY